MNRDPLQLHPPSWDQALSPSLVRWFRPWRRRKMIRTQHVVEVEIRGQERGLVNLLKSQPPAGILITPNHSTHADAYVMYEAADMLGTCLHFMSAYQVFTRQGKIGRWMMRQHGCFSIDREGADKHALKSAVTLLAAGAYPLVIFPEGEIYHQNDRITPLREGAAAIAILAAKKAPQGRNTCIIPCAMRYRYIDDPMPELLALMDRLEERILWRSRRTEDLPARIYRFAEALLALKEIEYLGATRTGGLPGRIGHLADTILNRLEARYALSKRKGEDNHALTIPERAKTVRQACLVQLTEIDDRGGGNMDTVQIIERDLDDVFLVLQAFSYPGDYVMSAPASIERLAETLDKFEEDVLGVSTATVRHTRRRCTLTFGSPIAINGPTEHPWKADALTRRLECDMQQLLDEGDGAAECRAVPRRR